MNDRELVLVVDDSDVVRTRMGGILNRNSLDVVLRENGEEGILAALEYYPDLIIMDVNMPQMDGLQACRILKSYPQTKMIPIAVFTDNRETEKKVEFFNIGVEDFINKDADEAEVIARVTGLLRWKSNRDKIIREKNKLGNLLDNLNDHVIIVDHSGRLVFFNRPAAERFNLIPELIMDKGIKDILPENEEVIEILSSIENHEEREDLELEIEHDKSKRFYKVDVCRVYIDLCEDVGGAVILKDVTAEREAEKLKSEFYSMIAHELRTPISVVLGYTQLIIDGKAGEVTGLQMEFLKGIEDKGRNLMKLVNEFLEVSRLENRFIKLEREVFDIAGLVERTIDGIRLLAENKNIKLEFRCKEESLSINGDKDKLEHVFINLIENAIKYTEDGGHVTVTCRRRGKGVQVEIRDNGIGMSEEEIEYIFDRFKRLDNVEKKKIKGTGLGLAIVKEIVDAHEGNIKVESKENTGSVFKLWLPDFLKSTESSNHKGPEEKAVTSAELK